MIRPTTDHASMSTQSTTTIPTAVIQTYSTVDTAIDAAQCPTKQITNNRRSQISSRPCNHQHFQQTLSCTHTRLLPMVLLQWSGRVNSAWKTKQFQRFKAEERIVITNYDVMAKVLVRACRVRQKDAHRKGVLVRPPLLTNIPFRFVTLGTLLESSTLCPLAANGQ